MVLCLASGEPPFSAWSPPRSNASHGSGGFVTKSLMDLGCGFAPGLAIASRVLDDRAVVFELDSQCFGQSCPMAFGIGFRGLDDLEADQA